MSEAPRTSDGTTSSDEPSRSTLSRPERPILLCLTEEAEERSVDSIVVVRSAPPPCASRIVERSSRSFRRPTRSSTREAPVSCAVR